MSDYAVALISHEYPPYSIGGIASHCHSLARALSRRSVPTVVFCGKSTSLTSLQENKYLTVVRMPFFEFPPRYLWFQIKNTKLISRLANGNCIFHGVDPKSSSWVFHKAKTRKLPVVVTLHEHPLAALKEFMTVTPYEWTFSEFLASAVSYPLNTYLVGDCLRSADAIVVPGRFTKDYLLKTDKRISPEKVNVMYNGVDFEEINRTEARTKENELDIISYGRLVSTKGFQFLLEIMPGLIEDFPGLRLQIVGKGPLESKLRSCISRLKIENNVCLRGYLEHSKLMGEIKNSDLIVLPTFHEVGPFIAALEAMACKKTIVLFNLSFSREFIMDGINGLLAKAFDADDLRGKVSLALSNRSLRNRLGQNACEYVKTHHNWDRIVDKYIDLYTSL